LHASEVDPTRRPALTGQVSTRLAEKEIGTMKTAHEIVEEFIGANNIDLNDFNEWFQDAGYPQEEANVHDSRYLEHLRTYVEDRAEREQET
jgi:hypothetical protein